MMRRIEGDRNSEEVEAAKKAVTNGIPLSRYAQLEEIADLIIFLNSDKASFITGAYQRIDGGASALSS